MRRPVICLAALALALLGFAGCGGGDDGENAAPATTAGATPTLSKEELIAQGDAICAEVNAAVGTVSSTAGDAASQATQVASLYSGMVERLRDLGRPEDEAGYAEFIGAAEALARAEGDPEAGASAALASFRSAADAYGFERCGEAPSAPAPAGAGAEEPSGEAPEGVEGEAAPEEEVEAAPEEAETGGAAAGGTEGGGESSGGGSSGGIGPG